MTTTTEYNIATTTRSSQRPRDLIETTATSAEQREFGCGFGFGLGHGFYYWISSLSLGILSKVVCRRRRRRFHKWISNRLRLTHTHIYTGLVRTWHRKAFKFNGSCLYALWAHGPDQSTPVQSPETWDLRPHRVNYLTAILTVFPESWNRNRNWNWNKANSNRPNRVIKLLANCKVSIKGRHRTHTLINCRYCREKYWNI